MKYTFTANTDTYSSKPGKKEAARISNKLEPVYVESIEGFLEDIEQGISWSPSVFNGPRSNKNWTGQCIMALDFDGGITPDAAIQRIQAYEITPNAWYPTFGDTPGKRKFRLIFFLDTLITNIDARNYLMDSLFAMYPEADKACENPAHFFYGTDKRGEVLNPKALSLDVLLSILEADKLKNGGRPRNIEASSEGATFLRTFGETKASYSNTI